MELRSLLKSGHSAALAVLALRAVQPALTLAMPTGVDSPPMGWTPIPDPADGGAGQPAVPGEPDRRGTSAPGGLRRAGLPPGLVTTG
jgi:hypothetical protein